VGYVANKVTLMKFIEVTRGFDGKVAH